MLLTRYEIMVGDEPQDIGFIQGLSDVSDNYIINEMIVETFNKKLIVPELKYFKKIKGYNTFSFFTQKGLELLKKEIGDLINYIKYCEADILTINKEISLEDSSILYKDELQVLISIKDKYN